MNFIEFLNTNQGAVTACLTFVYVIATIIIVYFNKRSIDEMKATREEEMRPYVFAYLAFVPRESKRSTLVVKNYGKCGARITAFKISPDLNLSPGKNDCSFLESTILAPGQSIRLLVIDSSFKLHEEKIQINVTYETLDGNTSYSESYLLIQQYVNQTGYVNTNMSGCEKWENALINISNSIDTIKTNML